ncbi:MAG: DUF721 domain-containing protein [Marinovum sp.]|nr:DUF721 domain-containing protein [Marinovum sp.]
MSGHRGKTNGFKRTSVLLERRIKDASQNRGFAQSRVLTHWSEIAGADIAEIAQPTNVSYATQGMGATLTLLARSGHGPELDMQKEKLRERINAVYGYNAITRIKISHTAASGFAEAQTAFNPRPVVTAPALDNKIADQARKTASPVEDQDLRRALEQLGQNVLTNSKPKTTF